MLILVFPKSFEFYKFLCYLLGKSDFSLYDFKATDEYEYTLHVMERQRQTSDSADRLSSSARGFCIRVLLIGDSDINFYSIFSKLADAVKGNLYLLVGSCGSPILHDLKHIFFVETAVKGDRGKLDKDSNFSWINKADKIASRSHGLWKIDCDLLEHIKVSKRLICSTNFLNENCIDEKFEKEKFLFDMETYDFFDICHKEEVPRYGCIRFVTDFVLPLPSDSPLESMDSLVQTYRQNIIQELSMFEDPKWDLSSLKKLYRLYVEIDFSSIFSIPFDLTEQVSDVDVQMNHVEVLFHHFQREFDKKVKSLNRSDELKVLMGMKLIFKDNVLAKNLEKIYPGRGKLKKVLADASH